MEFKKTVRRIEEFIKEQVESNKKEGVVIGLSGGIDSTMVAYLAVRALGKEKVLGVCLPYNTQEYKSGEAVAKKLGIKYRVLNIGNSVTSVFADFADLFDQNRLAMGNFMARMRMTLLYATAAKKNMLVIGTTNKSEYEIGYFTKWGDGAVDLEPIMELYKTEVIELAKCLGVPEEYIKKKPTAGLWDEQTDEGEIGMSYEKLDNLLQVNFVKGDEKDIERVRALVNGSQHKRDPIPHCHIANLR